VGPFKPRRRRLLRPKVNSGEFHEKKKRWGGKKIVHNGHVEKAALASLILLQLESHLGKKRTFLFNKVKNLPKPFRSSGEKARKKKKKGLRG